MTDDLTPLLERITFEPEGAELREIPWPYGLAPAAAPTALNFDGTLPRADVVVLTWTAAEARALADVLTPGAPSSGWVHYSKDWAKYEPQLTGRSPARDVQRLGEFHMSRINGLDVLCFHSQLHPATDGPTLPAAQLARQVAEETGARLFITTGTAGAANKGNVLGDVTVGSAVRSWFTRRLAGKPFSEQTWPTMVLSAKQRELLSAPVITPLFAANAHQLPAAYAPRLPQVWDGHIVSTDWFCFGSDNDACGLTAYDPQVTAVEMDDAAVAAGLSALQDPPAFAAVRNSSDPMLPDGSEQDLKLASNIYRRWGYVTTAGSAIVTWALIAGFGTP